MGGFYLKWLPPYTMPTHKVLSQSGFLRDQVRWHRKQKTGPLHIIQLSNFCALCFPHSTLAGEWALQVSSAIVT
jgi:hypothetical protein